MTGPVRFAVVTTQRTGSTWLTTLLDSHPDIDAYGELFLWDDHARPPWGAQGVERFSQVGRHGRERNGRPIRPFSTFAYLDALYESRGGAAAIGFKAMYDQLARHPEILAYGVRRHVRFVHLVRRNLLDIVISRELMVVRGKAHATSQGDVPRMRVRLDVGKVLRRMRLLEAQIAACRAALRLLPVRRVEITYECLRDQPAQTVQSVLRFLDVTTGTELTSPLVRMNDGDRSDLVENYGDVIRGLQKTRFAEFVAP